MSSDGTAKPPSFTPTGVTGPNRTTVRTQERSPDGAKDSPEATATSDEPKPAESTGAEQEVRGARPSPLVPGRQGETGTQRVGATAYGPGGRPAQDRRPAGAPTEAAATASDRELAATGPRRVRLALARVDPWSVMKLSFLLSFAVGIMLVVGAAVVWTTLDSMGIFADVNMTIAEIAGTPEFFNLEEYVAFERVMALATIVAIIDVVLLTALATLFAFLYNVVASLVGGVHLTLTDD